MKNFQAKALLTLAEQIPSLVASAGVAPDVAANLKSQVDAYLPVFAQTLDALEAQSEADHRKRRYRHVREDASLIAFRGLIENRPDLLAGPGGFSSLVEQSLSLGEAFAESWVSKLEQIEAKEDAALREMAELLADADAFGAKAAANA